MNATYDFKEKPKRTTALDAPLASIDSRLFALMIDCFIVGAIGGLTAVDEPAKLGFGVGLLVTLVYQWFFLTQCGGQTPGKMVMGIRVVKTDGTPLTTGDVIVRYFGYYINSMVACIGWLWATMDENKQGWHDKLARTYVVKSR